MKIDTATFQSLNLRERSAYFGLLLLGKTLAYLPWPLCKMLAKLGPSLFRAVLGERVEVIEANIDLAFPHLSSPEKAALVNENLQELLLGIFETSRSLFRSPEHFRDKITFEGLEHVNQAIAAGKGGIILVYHSYNMDLCGLGLRAILEGGDQLAVKPKSFALFRPLKNRALDALIADQRGNGTEMVAYTKIKTVVRGINDGGFCFYLFDQSNRRGVKVGFLGGQLWVNPAVQQLARMTEATVLPCALETDDQRSRYKIKFLPPLTDFASLEPEAAMQQAFDFLSAEVELAPSRYFWVHRLFKQKQEEAQNPYQPKSS